MSSSPSFFSQAENFSAISGGVDPRTGVYAVNINLGTVTGNNNQGPSLPIVLTYNPLNGLGLDTGPADGPFGAGVSTGLTTYDISNSPFRLTLSSGEQYLVDEFQDKNGWTIKIRQKKLDTVHIEKNSSQYTITYKSGKVEILNIPKDASQILVTNQIINATGHSLTLQWNTLPAVPQLNQITDDNNITLLSIDYTNPSSPSLTFFPASSQESYRVALQLQNGQLSTITNYALKSGPLTWTFSPPETIGDGRWGQWILGMTYPGGMKESVSYYQDGRGANFPDSAGLPFLPQAYRINRRPGGDTAVMTTLYSYTDYDFLGAGSGVDWLSTQDNLYFITGDYSYGSTETSAIDSTKIATTRRSYNKYHLLTDVEVSQNGTLHTTNTVYWLDKTQEFDGQPPQFQLPKTVTSTWQAVPTSSEGVREQVLQTVYDQNGNLTQRTDPDGTVTTCDYYPADGSVQGCPKDPSNFVRFVKKVTITPPTSPTTPQIVEYQYTAY